MPANAQYQAVNAAKRPSQHVSTPLSIAWQHAGWTPTKDTSGLLAGSRRQQLFEGQEEERQVECGEQEHKGDVCAQRANQHQEGENEPGKH